MKVKYLKEAPSRVGNMIFITDLEEGEFLEIQTILSGYKAIYTRRNGFIYLFNDPYTGSRPTFSGYNTPGYMEQCHKGRLFKVIEYNHKVNW